MIRACAQHAAQVTQVRAGQGRHEDAPACGAVSCKCFKHCHASGASGPRSTMSPTCISSNSSPPWPCLLPLRSWLDHWQMAAPVVLSVATSSACRSVSSRATKLPCTSPTATTRRFLQLQLLLSSEVVDCRLHLTAWRRAL